MFNYREFYEKQIAFDTDQIAWHREELERIKEEMREARELRGYMIEKGYIERGQKTATEKKLMNKRARHYRWIKRYKNWVEYYTKELEKLQ